MIKEKKIPSVIVQAKKLQFTLVKYITRISQEILIPERGVRRSGTGFH